MKFIVTEKSMDYSRSEAFTALPMTELLKALDLKPEMERSYLEKHSPSDLNYRANGSWDLYLDEGFWHVCVSVGCFCEHDCCGHLSSFGYNFQPEPDGLIRVEQSAAYNF